MTAVSIDVIVLQILLLENDVFMNKILGKEKISKCYTIGKSRSRMKGLSLEKVKYVKRNKSEFLVQASSSQLKTLQIPLRQNELLNCCFNNKKNTVLTLTCVLKSPS
jgi:hypothetical protein